MYNNNNNKSTYGVYCVYHKGRLKVEICRGGGGGEGCERGGRQEDGWRGGGGPVTS